jgi:hypothetical protein
MKPTMTILGCVLAAGIAAAQSPVSVIENTRTVMNGVRDNSAAASNAALGDPAPSAASATQASSQSKPAPSSSATSSSPKTATAAVKTAGKPAVKPAVKVAAQKGPALKTHSLPLKAVASRKHVQPISTAPVAKDAAPVSMPIPGVASGSDAPDGAASDDSPSKWNASGKRDPFLSPVVSHAGNLSCSTGKKCLEIGTINLRGIVHAESGFIAVVSNGLNKAYFLRENDPVFNGYVMKITGDSITFQETLQDRLGKTFTREVVKKITTPAV